MASRLSGSSGSQIRVACTEQPDDPSVALRGTVSEAGGEPSLKPSADLLASCQSDTRRPCTLDTGRALDT